MGNNAIEYGKVFDSEGEALAATIEMNKIATENNCSGIQFAVLPCVVMPKVKVTE